MVLAHQQLSAILKQNLIILVVKPKDIDFGRFVAFDYEHIHGSLIGLPVP